MVDQDLDDTVTDLKAAFNALRKVVDESLDSSREMALVNTKIDEAELWAFKALELQS